jgi:hypothetical protein
MAITTAMCNSFKTELLGRLHDLDSDTLRLALIKASPSGSYGASTTNYSDVTGNSDEATGTGYTATGAVLTGASISLSGSTAIVDFTDVVFTSSTISADGCIIYNTTTGRTGLAAGAAIAVIDFSGTKTSTNGDFTVEFPPSGGGSPDSTNAIIRIA